MFIDEMLRKYTDYRTIHEFAKVSEIPKQTLYLYNDIEKARNMALSRAKLLSDELGITIEIFVKEVGL